MNYRKYHPQLVAIILMFVTGTVAQAASDGYINVDASIVSDDNVSRGAGYMDVESDVFATVGANLGYLAKRFDDGLLLVELDLVTDQYAEFDGLSNYSVAAGATYIYSPWSGFTAPWFAVEAQYKIVDYKSTLRDSNILFTELRMGKHIDDRTDMLLGLGYRDRDSNSVAFDTKNISLFINIDWKLKQYMTLYTTYKYDTGDIYSSGDTASLPNINPVWAEADDVFLGKTAYRVDGTTHFITLGLNLERNSVSAFDLSVRYISSTGKGGYISPGVPYADLTYEVLIARLSYIHQFGL